MTENDLIKLVEIEHQIEIPFAGPQDPRLIDLKLGTLSRLKERRLYDGNLIYMPFNGGKVPVVCTWGVDIRRHYKNPGHIFVAMHENEEKGTRRLDHANGLEFAIYLGFELRLKTRLARLVGKENDFAIACYDGSFFNHYRIFPSDHSLKEGLTFKDALKCVVLYKKARNQ